MYIFSHLTERVVGRAKLEIKNYFPDEHEKESKIQERGISRKFLYETNFYHIRLLSSSSSGLS